MLYRVFEAVLSENPDLTAWAIDSLSCVSDTDYTNRENKGTDIPSAFRSCRLININGRMLCVGSSFNLKTKQTLIDKLLENAYLSKDIFKIERILYDNKLKPWQRTAARTVFAQLKKASYSDRGIGIVSQPTGTERDAVLAEVIRLLFEKSKAEQSVLILTEKAVIAEQLTGRLNELSGGF